jgi:hypothetical protein
MQSESHVSHDRGTKSVSRIYLQSLDGSIATINLPPRAGPKQVRDAMGTFPDRRPDLMQYAQGQYVAYQAQPESYQWPFPTE